MLHSICKQIWKTQQRHRIEKVRFCSNSKEGQCQECSNYYIIVLISHAHFIARLCSKSIKLGFSSTELRTSKCTRWALKSRRTRNQIANILWIMEKVRKFQKNIYFCFTDYTKAFDCVEHNKQWKIPKKDENTRPPYLPLEKLVCMSRSNSQDWTWNNELVQNWESSTSRLYIITLLI